MMEAIERCKRFLQAILSKEEALSIRRAGLYRARDSAGGDRGRPAQ